LGYHHHQWLTVKWHVPEAIHVFPGNETSFFMKTLYQSRQELEFEIWTENLPGSKIELILEISANGRHSLGNDPNYNVTVYLICTIGTVVVFLAPMTIVGYFWGLKFQEKLIDNFTIILAKDRITVNTCGLANTTIHSNEISEVVEGRSGLKVRSKGSKPKTVLIPKNLEGYEDLKRELQGWVN
jgi:hypothetical protein